MSDVTSGLKFSVSLLGGNRHALKYGSAAFASHRDYQIHVINRNILAKAAQLVNDLEDARAAKITLESFMARNAPQSPNAGRGGIFDSRS